MIDFHCHLDLYPDPQDVAAQCDARGLYVLSVTTTPSAWHGTLALAPTGSRIRTALGLHPQLAHERHSELPLFDQLLDGTRYVGEIGLDGAPEFAKHAGVQSMVFSHILDACSKRGGRILSIHSRRATKPVLDALQAHPEVGTPVLHWFGGSFRDVDRALQMGCWFSVGPAMLKSEAGRKLATHMPRERVLTESDGPFAQMHRAALLPWEAGKAAATFAELWDISTEQVDQVLLSNLRSLLKPYSEITRHDDCD